MTKKVHELAKELKLTSKELLSHLKRQKIKAKSHLSVLSDTEIKTARSALKKGAAEKKASPAPAKKPKAPKKEEKKAPPELSSLASAKSELLKHRIQVKKTQPLPRKATKSIPAPRPDRGTGFAPGSRPGPASRKAAAAEKLDKLFGRKAAGETAEEKPEAPAKPEPAPPPVTKDVELEETVLVKDLAVLFSITPSDLIQRLIQMGVFASINQAVVFDVASKLAESLGYRVKKKEARQAVTKKTVAATTDKARLVTRAPIVTFMGHVDHGKTSLLDAIRNSKITAKESGGITQHIGAYEVFLPKGAVTFLDTPGHEAFTAMRARGAKATDVVVLVVAADDGVMPQTIEAIDHAKAAEVPIVVAINKVDLPGADLDRVKKNLMSHGLTAEDWGGKTIMVPVSAKTGQGIDKLLEMLSLESELLELKADPTASASGSVVEAQLSKGRGVAATLLVQNGTLRVGDLVVVDDSYCKIRAMTNDRLERVTEALPAMPVEILGLPKVPKAGDIFKVVKSEAEARSIVDKRLREKQQTQSLSHISLQHLHEDIKAGKIKELKLILKVDVQGSLEAIRATLDKIKSKNVRLNIIHTGSGNITQNDIMLAAASNAVVIGFRTGIVGAAREAADREGVDVHFYDVIYRVGSAIEKAMQGLLEPEAKEVFAGLAEVQQVFKLSRSGMIAGCKVKKGRVVRNFPCRVLRNGKNVFEGKIQSLKRFKDDAREVAEGFECGIGVSNFKEILSGDRIEVFEIQSVERKLE